MSHYEVLEKFCEGRLRLCGRDRHRMDRERSRKIEALYEAALGLEPERRAAFLAENCAGDESLRREIESLLLHDENAGSFLEVPALGRLPQAG